jgi:hypothetical protein
MYAFEGDRIIVRPQPGTIRVAEVIDIFHGDGRPPYWVRWSDSGEEALLFPPEDADVERAGPRHPAEY